METGIAAHPLDSEYMGTEALPAHASSQSAGTATRPRPESPSLGPLKNLLALATPRTGKKYGTSAAEARDEVKVALHAFPVEVQQILAPFDHDQDGMLHAAELEAAAHSLIESRKTVKKLFRMTFLFLIVMGVLCAALGGIVFAVVELTRQLDVVRGDILAVKGTTTPVKVTSTALLQTSSLSSNLPQDVFDDMRFLKVIAPSGAELTLAVSGTARIPTGLPPYGNSVQIYLGNLGYVQLAGEDIVFEEGLANIFKQAGLVTTNAGARRRLLSSTNVHGLFNRITPVPPVPRYQTPGPQPVHAAVSMPNQIVVMLKVGYTTFNCSAIRSLKRIDPVGGVTGTFVVSVSNTHTLTSVIARVETCPEVAAVVADFSFEGHSVGQPIPVAAPKSRRLSAEDSHMSAAGLLLNELRGNAGDAEMDPERRRLQYDYLIPNDPLYWDPGMWAHSYMMMLQAWSVTEGSQDAPICLVDSGVLASHEDLQGQLWVNPGEIPGDGIDNDGNGYIDDVNGVHINLETGVFDNNLTDENGHGTHATGIIAGVVNNGKGAAGLAPKSRIMICKAATANRGPLVSELARCIDYCHSMGSRIVSSSYGSCTTNTAAASFIKSVFQRYPDTLFVFSAGNNGKYLPSYDGCGFPGRINLPNVVNVGATDWFYERTYFSNYGPKAVDLAAPGDYILSTSNSGGYEIRMGTSSAAPHVAAIAAMIKGMNSSMTGPDIRNLLVNYCDQIINGYNIFQCGGMLSGGRPLSYLQSLLNAVI